MSAKTMIENALPDKDVQIALAGYDYDEAKLQAEKPSMTKVLKKIKGKRKSI